MLHEIIEPFCGEAVRCCIRCRMAIEGRLNKKFCSSNCRKRSSEPKRNSQESPTKRRENMEFFERAKRLAEELYLVPPPERLGFMSGLIAFARTQDDAQLKDILSNYILLHPHPKNDTFLFPKSSPSYCTIAQAASNYCKRYWRANVKDVVYWRVEEPDTGEVSENVLP